MKNTVLLLSITIVIMLAACQPATTTKSLPPDLPVDVKFDDNLKIQILSKTDDEFGLIINIAVANKTGNDIWFPENFGLQMYQLDDSSNWTRVEDSMGGQMPVDGYILKPYRDVFDVLTYSFAPDISRENKKWPLRIYVIGHKMKGGNVMDELISTYIDVNLEK